MRLADPRRPRGPRRARLPRAAHAITLTRPADAAAPASGHWLRILSQIPLPPGQFQLRVAAGGGRRAGSVVYDVKVPDFWREPLVLSGVTITAASARAVHTLRAAPASGAGPARRCQPPSCIVPLATEGTSSAEDPLHDALPGPPTTAREFDRSDTLALFAEVSSNGRRPATHTITMTTSLQDADGVVLATAVGQRSSAAPGRPSGGHGFTTQLSLRSIPPGRYLLHVTAESDAVSGAAVSRAVPITVR